MGEPFRDGMSAALARIDQLAGENEELRGEIEQLRTRAQTVKTSTSDEHANALADQTLRVLEQLEVLSQRRPATASSATEQVTVAATEAPALRGPDPAPRGERVEPSVMVAAERRSLSAPLAEVRPPAQQVSRARWIAACVGCFVLGLVVGVALLGH